MPANPDAVASQGEFHAKKPADNSAKNNEVSVRFQRFVLYSY